MIFFPRILMHIIKHLQSCVIRNTDEKRKFQQESLSHDDLSSITWALLRSQRATEQNDLITLAVDFKEAGRRNSVNCSQDFWATEQWLWNGAGVRAAEGQVDDVTRERVQPQRAWMSYWSATNIDHNKSLFLFESFSAAEITRPSWRQTLPTFLFIHLWHNKWTLKDSSVQHSRNWIALKMRVKRLKCRQE